IGLRPGPTGVDARAESARGEQHAGRLALGVGEDREDGAGVAGGAVRALAVKQAAAARLAWPEEHRARRRVGRVLRFPRTAHAPLRRVALIAHPAAGREEDA